MNHDAKEPSDEGIRPRDLALWLLASRDTLPRRRARDQQADVAGLELKRRILSRLAALDPAPDQLLTVLSHIVEEIGPPSGPARAIATMVEADWQAARAGPAFAAHLLAEAVRHSDRI